MKQEQLITDMMAAVQLILLFICMIFIALTPTYLMQNLIALFVVFALMLFAYFTSPTATLMANLVVLFLYMSYLLYDMLISRAEHGFESFFWVFFLPAVSFCTAALHSRKNAMEEDYHRMREHAEHAVTLDYDTGLRTLSAYSSDLTMLQHLAKRNELQTLLIVWELRFHNQMNRMLSPRQFHSLMNDISAVMRETFRTEDMIYILRPDPALWGIVTLVHPGNAEKMAARLRERIEKIDLRETMGKRAPMVELRIGTKYDEGNELSPEAMLAGAISQMQYDV